MSRTPPRWERPDGMAHRLLLARNTTHLEVLTATVAFVITYELYPRRATVARFLGRDTAYVARSTEKLERWGLVAVVLPVGARHVRVLWVLERGFEVLEAILERPLPRPARIELRPELPRASVEPDPVSGSDHEREVDQDPSVLPETSAESSEG